LTKPLQFVVKSGTQTGERIMPKFNVSIVRTYEIDLRFDNLVEARTQEEAEGYARGLLDGSCGEAEDKLQQALEGMPDDSGDWSFSGEQIGDGIDARPIADVPG
jgi:hypothetical protein